MQWNRDATNLPDQRVDPTSSTETVSPSTMLIAQIQHNWRRLHDSVGDLGMPPHLKYDEHYRKRNYIY